MSIFRYLNTIILCVFGTFVIACLVNLKYSRILVATLYMYERDTIST